VIVPKDVVAVAVNVALLPAKIEVQLAAIDTVGASTELTTCEAVAVHPFASVFVTEYVPEAETVIASVVSVVLQTFPPTTLEVNVTEPGLQKSVAPLAEIDTLLAGNTVTTSGADDADVHPFPSV
jgi:hypothetical protein